MTKDKTVIEEVRETVIGVTGAAVETVKNAADIVEKTVIGTVEAMDAVTKNANQQTEFDKEKFEKSLKELIEANEALKEKTKTANHSIEEVLEQALEKSKLPRERVIKEINFEERIQNFSPYRLDNTAGAASISILQPRTNQLLPLLLSILRRILK